jgi:hypothetical protein
MESEVLFKLEEKEFDDAIENLNENELKKALCFAYGYMFSQMHKRNLQTAKNKEECRYYNIEIFK